MQPPWRILLLDTKRSDPNHYLSLALRDAFVTHPGVGEAVLASYGDALTHARRGGEWDLFIAFGGEEMDEALCARVIRFCRRSVLWVTEDPYERTSNAARARLFDLVLTNDSASVDFYKNTPARHLPLAASESWHFQPLPAPPAPAPPYLYDIFFAGTAWPNRVHLLRALTTALPTLKYKLALPYNPYLPVPDLGPDWPRSALNWRVPNREFCRLANRSRITLGLHRDFTGTTDNPSLAQTPGPRLFEIALAGGFQLVDGALTEINSYYAQGTEYAAFADDADCLEKVRYYLDHAAERESMARAAQQTTRTRHLYAHRVDQILQWVTDLPPLTTHHPQPTTARSAPAPSPKRNLLFVAHNTMAGDHFGGVEVVMQLIEKELAAEFNVFSYAPWNRDGQSTGAILYGPGLLELRRFEFPPIRGNVMLSDPAREAAFAQVLNDCAIDLVHFHHLIGHVASLPLISRAYGIPSTLTIYDYFNSCVLYNLLNFEQTFCAIEHKPKETCDVCLSAQFHYPRGAQERRKNFFARIFDAVDGLVFISRDCRDRTQKHYPGTRMDHKSLVIDLPVPYADELRISQPTPSRWKPPYKVVSFGNFTHAKGADVMLRAFNQLRDSPFEFHLYGRADEPYPAVLEALNFPNVRVHKKFTPGSLREVLQQAALSLHISVWPETFCITVAEAMHFGVVPIVSDLGAPAERIVDGVNGFRILADEPGALVALLDRLAADPSSAIRVHEHLATVKVQGAREHAALMAAHYRKLLDAVPAPPRPAIADGAARGRLTLEDCGITLANPSWCLDLPGPPAEPAPTPSPSTAPKPGNAAVAVPVHIPATLPPSLQPPVTDPALFFDPGYIWRRAVYQTRTRGLMGSLRWHGNMVRKIFRR